MRRGDVYLVKKPGRGDPKRRRAFVVVSRQALIESRFSTLVCAPVYSRHDGLSTQVRIGLEEGLRQESSVHCDELVSLPRSMLTDYIGRLGEAAGEELNRALLAALDLDLSPATGQPS